MARATEEELTSALEVFNAALARNENVRKAQKAVDKAERRKQEAANALKKLQDDPKASADDKAAAEAAYRESVDQFNALRSGEAPAEEPAEDAEDTEATDAEASEAEAEASADEPEAATEEPEAETATDEAETATDEAEAATEGPEAETATDKPESAADDEAPADEEPAEEPAGSDEEE